MYLDNKDFFFKRVSSSFKPAQVQNKGLVTSKTLSNGFHYIFNVLLQNNDLSTRIDALERISDNSRLEDFSYVPILVLPHLKVSKYDKLVLTYNSLLLRKLQRKLPQYGKIVYANSQKISKVRIDKSEGRNGLYWGFYEYDRCLLYL